MDTSSMVARIRDPQALEIGNRLHPTELIGAYSVVFKQLVTGYENLMTALTQKFGLSQAQVATAGPELVAPDAPLGRMVASGRLSSIVLWGPPGCGKTTIARLLADRTGLVFEQVSATFSGVADLRKVFTAAARRREIGQGTLLFVDEIHRFNRAQQDSFLPYVEDGTVVLVGATTENPSFELNGALLSRCQVMVLRRLDEAALTELLARAESLTGRSLSLTEEARTVLLAMADGDGRYLLGMVEQVLAAQDADGPEPLDVEGLRSVIASRAPLYDKSREEHYNLISALHKSMRGSDPDAALYWLTRMLGGGEDPLYVARRLVRFASEDVGMADPAALRMTLADWDAYERLGSPEGELAIAQAVVYLATAPKSIAIYRGYGRAARLARETGSLMPPTHILNAPTRLMKELGYGEGYEYDPDTTDGFSGADYLPDGVERRPLYEPTANGHERRIRERLGDWASLATRSRACAALMSERALASAVMKTPVECLSIRRRRMRWSTQVPIMIRGLRATKTMLMTFLVMRYMNAPMTSGAIMARSGKRAFSSCWGAAGRVTLTSGVRGTTRGERIWPTSVVSVTPGISEAPTRRVIRSVESPTVTTSAEVTVCLVTRSSPMSRPLAELRSVTSTWAPTVRRRWCLETRGSRDRLIPHWEERPISVAPSGTE